VCSVSLTPTINPGAGGGKSCAQRSKAKGMKSAEGVSVNMDRLGESFVENVSDVRRRATVDSKAAAPGESLEFLAQIRGWQSEARKQRRDQLLQLNDIGLRVALTRAAGAYGAESVENVEFARSKRSSSKMNGTNSSLPYASVFHW
jgi:hypothetical protein